MPSHCPALKRGALRLGLNRLFPGLPWEALKEGNVSPLVLSAPQCPRKCHLPKQPGKKGVRFAVGFWVLGSLWFEARSSARDL